MNKTSVAISALTAFVISAGGAIGIVAASGNTLNQTVWILSAVVGAISAAKDVRSLLQLPPVDTTPPVLKPASDNFDPKKP